MNIIAYNYRIWFSDFIFYQFELVRININGNKFTFFLLKSHSVILPPAIRFTVSRTCSERIWRIVTPLSRCIGVSVLLLRMHLTKCGLAWTRVLKRLSNLVWKSCVNVDIGSSPFKLQSTCVTFFSPLICR